ncbi:MAG: Hsp20/alpha crystallin family protein [Acidobacteriota bacterium]|nr:Hsp20/alpha crystallin family protein [Acidobacteriota bacterium]
MAMPLLVRSEPYRDLDRLFQQLMGESTRRVTSLAMPMDAFRKEDQFLLQFDLPGVDSSTIELTVDNSTLTVKAERRAPLLAEGIEALVAERPHGSFTRQILLGDNLDTTKIDARYADGVLTLAIPVAEEAKPRKIEVRHESPLAEIAV